MREARFIHSVYIRRSCKTVAHSTHSLSRKSPVFVKSSFTNMLLALVMAAVLVPVFAASPVIEGQAKPHVVRYEMGTANMPNSYNFYYDTSDGSSRTERGEILNPGTKEAALDVLGTVRWYDNKGQLYEMSYKAGKRGYRTIIKKVS